MLSPAGGPESVHLNVIFLELDIDVLFNLRKTSTAAKDVCLLFPAS
jgi:hypothetical protein